MNSHRIYVLSCWQGEQTNSHQNSPWRFRVETVGAEPAQQGFGSLEGLLNFLQKEFPLDPSTDLEPGIHKRRLPIEMRNNTVKT